MDFTDVSKFKRKPDVIKNKVKHTNKMFIAKDELFIMFPTKFVDKDLATLDNVSSVIGIFIVFDKAMNYSVIKIPAKIKIEPSEIEDIVINETPYTVFHIEKDQALFTTDIIIKDLDVVFPIFDLFLLQGKVPWYLNYLDFYELFLGLEKYAGSKVGKSVLGLSALTAINARDKKDPEVEFRTIVKTEADLTNKHPEWVGLKNIYYSFKSTLSKIAGAYFKQGLIAGVVKPEKETTDLEYVLRK